MNKYMFKEIGAAIATERTRQGLRVGDLGVDPHVVEAIEGGKPGITTLQLEKIASALQLDPNALRTGEIQARPQPSVFLRPRKQNLAKKIADSYHAHRAGRVDRAPPRTREAPRRELGYLTAKQSK